MEEQSFLPWQDSRHTRRRGRVAFCRGFVSDSKASSSDASSEAERARRGRKPPQECPKTREIPTKIVINDPLYADVFE